MKQSITKKIFSKILFIIFPLLIIVGFGWLYNLKMDTQNDIEEFKLNYLNEQKRIIKDHVDVAVSYINTIKKLRYISVKNNIKESVTQAYVFI